jgi:hypothetical protein
MVQRVRLPLPAYVDGKSVLASSDQFTHPTAIVFVSDEHAVPNWMNIGGLPAPTFCARGAERRIS